MNLKKLTCHYDQPAKMSRDQLELAWLGSIFEDPAFCRKYGLLGLDQSMFQNSEAFEFGAELLRDENFKGHVPNPELMRRMMNNRWLSRIGEAELSGEYLPAFFRIYAEEIESRSQNLELDPQWKA